MDRTQFLATRGAPQSVLLALILNGPQTAAELVQFAYLDQRTVSRGLALLDDLGLVKQGKDGRWTSSAVSISAKDDDAQDVSGDYTRGACSSSSSSLLDPRSRNSGEKKKKEAHTARSHSEQGKIFQLLLAAGVGARSPKMRELLDLALAPEFVAGHVEYRQRQLARGEDVPVGHLIQRLQSGDPVPVERANRVPYDVEELYREGIVQR